MKDHSIAGQVGHLPSFLPGGSETGKTAALLCVVMPCFNEARTVNEIIRRVLAQSVVAQLIIVDDGSTDGTWDLLAQWPAHDARVQLVRHERNRGKGAALRSGFAVASAPWVVVQDADLEYNPADYPALLQPILRGEADVVYGSRFFEGAPRGSPWWHWTVNRLLTLFSNWVTGLRLTDEATCYKLFRRELLHGILLKEDGFGFCPELTATFSRQNVKILEVPIRYNGRSRAQGKKLRLRHGAEAVWCLLKYSYGQRKASHAIQRHEGPARPEV